MLTKTKTYDGEEFYKAKEVDKQFELLKKTIKGLRMLEIYQNVEKAQRGELK